MEADRWDQLALIFEQALALAPGDRAAFLDDACGDDEALRRQLDSLLGYKDEAHAYFDDLAADVFEGLAAAETSVVRPSQRVGPYEVVEKLGGGGMGVVYKAQDTRLDRPVALKFLPPALSADAQAKQRFIAEAKAASALDHPNICTIHEIGETDDGQLFIAMAYYDGQTLKQKINEGPLAAEEALGIAAQIARGLEKAHAKHIIHRDIKPANVMITGDGVVKLLDFGLAKMADVQLTQTGTTMGTVAYMSPEQARGETVDHRTDLWSLGVVLYEMLAGERPFTGDHEQAIIYGILHHDPAPLPSIHGTLRERLERAVGTALQKEAAQRFQTASTFRADLEAAGHAEVASEEAVSQRPVAITRRRAVWLGSGVLALVVVLAAWAFWQGTTALPAEKHLVVLAQIPTEAAAADRALADGLAETLVNSLELLGQSQPAFWVVPSAQVRQNSIETPAEAWRAFGINMAVTLAMERDADNLHVTLDVLDAAQEQSLRRVELVHPSTELTALRDDLIASLADLLDVDLTPMGQNPPAIGGPVVPGTYDFYVQGVGYLQRFDEAENLEAAIALFDRAIDRDSSFALAYAGLGEAYRRRFEKTRDLQWMQRAEFYTERAIELDDRLTSAYVSLGFIQTGLGRYGWALSAFRIALEQDSTNVDAYRGRAKVYQEQDRLDEAEATYKRAIRAKPDYWAAYSDLAVFYYTQSRYEDAIEQFEHVLALTPLNAMAHSNLGAMYWFLDRMEDASTMFQRAVDLDPQDFASRNNLATLYFYQGAYKEAAQAYEEVVKFHDTDYEVWGNLAEAYYWANQREQARQTYTRAAELAQDHLDRNPRDRTARVFLATYYAKLARNEEARALLADLANPEPTVGLELFHIGEAYEQLGEREQALQWIEKALQQGYTLSEINTYPGLEDLRGDARFQAMLGRMRGDES